MGREILELGKDFDITPPEGMEALSKEFRAVKEEHARIMRELSACELNVFRDVFCRFGLGELAFVGNKIGGRGYVYCQGEFTEYPEWEELKKRKILEIAYPSRGQYIAKVFVDSELSFSGLAFECNLEVFKRECSAYMDDPERPESLVLVVIPQTETVSDYKGNSEKTVRVEIRRPFELAFTPLGFGSLWFPRPKIQSVWKTLGEHFETQMRGRRRASAKAEDSLERMRAVQLLLR